MLKIYGGSDNIIEVEGIGNVLDKCPTCGRSIDEPNQAETGAKDAEIGSDDATFTIGNKEMGGLFVRMMYGRFDVACWSAEICQLDEDVPIPWPVKVTHGGPGYSVVVEVDVPEGVPVRWKTTTE